MFYAVIQPVEADGTAIEAVGARHDPYHGVVAPHVTLVFPIDAADLTEAVLIDHATAVARTTPPFPVYLVDLELSWDQWLFLTPRTGRAEFVALHDALYSGPLRRFLRRDLPFVPHVAVGHFARSNDEYSVTNPRPSTLDADRYAAARKEMGGIEVRYTASRLAIIALDQAITRSDTVSTIPFSGRR